MTFNLHFSSSVAPCCLGSWKCAALASWIVRTCFAFFPRIRCFFAYLYDTPEIECRRWQGYIKPVRQVFYESTKMPIFNILAATVLLFLLKKVELVHHWWLSLLLFYSLRICLYTRSKVWLGEHKARVIPSSLSKVPGSNVTFTNTNAPRSDCYHIYQWRCKFDHAVALVYTCILHSSLDHFYHSINTAESNPRQQ